MNTPRQTLRSTTRPAIIHYLHCAIAHLKAEGADRISLHAADLCHGIAAARAAGHLDVVNRALDAINDLSPVAFSEIAVELHAAAGTR